EEQRVAFLLAQFGRFLGLGFSDVPGVDRDDAGAPLMRRHHYPIRLVGIHAEDRLEHEDDEFARRVVVVEKNDFVERRLLRLRLDLGLWLDEGLAHCSNSAPGGPRIADHSARGGLVPALTKYALRPRVPGPEARDGP